MARTLGRSRGRSHEQMTSVGPCSHTAVSRWGHTSVAFLGVGPDLQDLVDEVSRVLATPATLEDADFTLLVFAEHADEVDPVRQRTIFQRRSSAEVQDWFEEFGIGCGGRPLRTPADPAAGILTRPASPPAGTASRTATCGCSTSTTASTTPCWSG